MLFAYEENLNTLSILIVFFSTKIRNENPETYLKKKNGKKRCFPQRTGNQEPAELFKSIICFKDKGDRFCEPGNELKKKPAAGGFFLNSFFPDTGFLTT